MRNSGMNPPSMAPLVFLFGLTISCILVLGAGAEILHYTWHSQQGMVPAKALRRAVEQFLHMNTQSREACEEQRREQELRSAWEKRDPSVNRWSSRASRWHATLLAMAAVTCFLVVRCCHGLRELWMSCTRATTHSDTWHGEQDSVQVGMSDSEQEDMWSPHSVWCPVATVLRSWTPNERWEDMDGSPDRVERALHVLVELLLEEAKATAGHVGWMFLTTLLRRNTEDALNEVAQEQDQSPCITAYLSIPPLASWLPLRGNH